MLFSEDGSEVLCVIDLDTVMPSFIFSDYGDFLRTAASTAAEDEPDFSKIQFRQDVFQAFTKGYLASARSFLTPLEIQMLPYAVVLFPTCRVCASCGTTSMVTAIGRCSIPPTTLSGLKISLSW